MMGRGIAYAFAAVGACLTTFAAAQSQTTTQPGAANGTPSAASAPVASAQRQNSEPTPRVPALAALHKHIDIVLSETSLKQAMSMIARQSGMQIVLDPRVKSTATVTVEGANVSIYRVLEMILHQPGTGMLMISPKSGGLLIEPIPTTEVGKRTFYKVSNPPWNDTWFRESSRDGLVGVAATRQGQFPAQASGQSVAAGQSAATNPTQSEAPVTVPAGVADATVAPRLTQSRQSEPDVPSDVFAGGRPAAQGVYPPQIAPGVPYGGGAPQAMPGYPAVPQFAPVTDTPAGYMLNGSLSVMVTALSDKSFVVTEPGLGPKNEVGVYLTVYRIEGAGTKSGETLREVSRIFHKSANGGRTIARNGVMLRGSDNYYPRNGADPLPAPKGSADVPRYYSPVQPLPGGLPQRESVPPPAPQEPKLNNNVTDPSGARTPSADVLGGETKTPEDPFENR